MTVMTKLVSTAVTTKLVVTAIMTKLVISAYFWESCHRYPSNASFPKYWSKIYWSYKRENDRSRCELCWILKSHRRQIDSGWDVQDLREPEMTDGKWTKKTDQQSIVYTYAWHTHAHMRVAKSRSQSTYSNLQKLCSWLSHVYSLCHAHRNLCIKEIIDQLL